MTAATTSSSADHGPPPLDTTAAITTFGTLAWVVWVWVVAAVAFTGILVAVGVWGALEASLWEDLGAGMQRWLFLVIGFTMVSEFGRMFLLHGVTRAQLSRSAAIAGVVLAGLGAVVATVGYLGETAVFAQHDWPHVLEDGSAAVNGAGGVMRLGGESALTLLAFFTSGWLVGAVYRSRPQDEAHVLLLPALLPAAAAQLLVRGGTAVFGFLDRIDPGVSPGLGAAITTVAVAVGMVTATRLTREVVL